MNYDDDIARFHTRSFVGFAVESILVVVRCALVDLGFEHLLLLYDLFAFADFAHVLGVDDLSLTTAIVTRTLGL